MNLKDFIERERRNAGFLHPDFLDCFGVLNAPYAPKVQVVIKRNNPPKAENVAKEAQESKEIVFPKEFIDSVLRVNKLQEQLKKERAAEPKTQVQPQFNRPRNTPKNLAENYHIEIHNDGKTTQCSLYYNDNLVRRTYAKLDPEDKFNLATGAKIALERMFPSKKKGER